MTDITPELILRAYSCGLFPMADDRNSPDLFWVDPESRGILPLERFHLPRSLKKVIRQDRFTVTVNTAFSEVILGCAESKPGRENTWINSPIEQLYTQLHHLGAAHSVECWDSQGLAGGLYGVDLTGAFFGESMFHRRTDASKVALAHLVARLRAGGYKLLDCQFITDHLARFGAQEMPKQLYHGLLKRALQVRADFNALPSPCSGARALAELEGPAPC